MSGIPSALALTILFVSEASILIFSCRNGISLFNTRSISLPLHSIKYRTNNMMARFERILAVLFKRVGIKAVNLFRKLVRLASDKNLKPIFCWIVVIELLAELTIAVGSSRKALILGLIKVTARNIGNPIKNR